MGGSRLVHHADGRSTATLPQSWSSVLSNARPEHAPRASNGYDRICHTGGDACGIPRRSHGAISRDLDSTPFARDLARIGAGAGTPDPRGAVIAAGLLGFALGFAAARAGARPRRATRSRRSRPTRCATTPIPSSRSRASASRASKNPPSPTGTCAARRSTTRSRRCARRSTATASRRRRSSATRSRHTGELGSELRELAAQTSRLNNALRGTAARGRWGELTLRRTAELAGLSEHCDFAEQVTLGGAAAQRPICSCGCRAAARWPWTRRRRSTPTGGRRKRTRTRSETPRSTSTRARCAATSMRSRLATTRRSSSARPRSWCCSCPTRASSPAPPRATAR